MGDTISSEYKVVVIQGHNISTVISNMKKSYACDIFEITSLDDIMSFLKKKDFSSLRLTGNNDGKTIDTFLNSIGQQNISIEFDNPSGQFQRPFKRVPKTIHDMEKQHIIKTLHLYKWKYKSTAQALGINRTTLYRKMKKYNISPAKKK